MNQHTNKLAHASSPYLRQHAHNPVDWYEWGDEALEKAQIENKPIIISIGYAACHWCHVMARKSFMNSSIAALMNENFVCIKVDREERADLDLIYMDAAHILTGSGGWPLNAFALPDGRPFFAGTYFTPSQWIDALTQISKLYKTNKENVIAQAEKLTKGINDFSFYTLPEQDNSEFNKDTYPIFFEAWKHQIDTQNGGINKAPKFPLPISWESALMNFAITQNNEALQLTTLTLDAIIKGGIYDLVGGGFCRYATDTNWKIPHFEKMLYDNGQLVSLFSHAFKITKNEEYSRVIKHTLESIQREFTNPEGGFYSSLNADSEGEEGKYYVWSKNELQTLLNTKEYSLVEDFYSISKKGNWESGKNIIWATKHTKEYSHKKNIEISELHTQLDQIHSTLLQARNNRVAPSTDDKILSSWNAIMLQGYIDAYKALGIETYKSIAIKNANFIINNLIEDDGKIWRNFAAEKQGISGFLDDYALIAQSFLSIYEITFDIEYLNQCRKIVEYAIMNFYDCKTGFFFYTQHSEKNLVARKYEISDNVIPSSNSVMGVVLYKLSMLFEEERYHTISETMLARVQNNIPKYGAYYSNWANLFAMHAFGLTEVCILGDKANELAKEIQCNYIPNVIFAGGTKENLPILENKLQENKSLLYVCKNKSCHLQTEKIAEVITEITSATIFT